MPSKHDDDDDVGFLDGLNDLLGIGRQKAEGIIAKLDGDALLALADAVSAGDADAAKEALGDAAVDEDEAKEPGADDDADEPDAEDEDEDETQFNVGDAVRVGDTDGTVRLADGPHDTVGVMMKGKLKMVDRKKVVKLDEMVLGMTGMPNLKRMQELAGIMAVPDQMPAAADVAAVAAPAVVSEPVVACCKQDAEPVVACMDALDMLEKHLPGVRLADLKGIRQRIFDISAKMNESATKRKPKV
jgi:hypothetical protein